MLLYSRRRFGDFNRARRGSFDAGAAQIVGGGKSPGAVGDDTRMPKPNDSATEALPTLPFLVERSRWRSSARRTSA